jgi:hypothetical protein
MEEIQRSPESLTRFASGEARFRQKLIRTAADHAYKFRPTGFDAAVQLAHVHLFLNEEGPVWFNQIIAG